MTKTATTSPQDNSLRSRIGRASNQYSGQSFNQSVYTQLALTTEEIPAMPDQLHKSEIRSQIAQETRYEINNRQMVLQAANNWEAAIEYYKNKMKSKVSKKTMEGYVDLWATFTKWLKEQEIYDRIPPAFLTSSVISDYLDNMVTVRGNTKLTADKKRTALMVLYKFLMERGVVDKNPVVETSKLGKDKGGIIYSFTAEQIKAIFSVIPINTWRGARDYCMYRMILETGCRLDECEEVKIPDITFVKEVPTVVRFLDKNGEYKEIDITPKLAHAIMNWLEKRRSFRVSNEEAPYLHISQDLQPLSRRIVEKYFKEYCVLAGVDKSGVRCSPYTLKHTFCKLFLLGGGSVNALRKIVGHIDARSIQKYTDLVDKERTEQHMKYAPSEIFDF